jgi:soluble lytic murein transglycosylase-like protein
LIQFAHKRADKGFNDIVAQLYDQELKTQEKAKYEHIRQAKEKALEEQRVSEENQRRAEADRIAREHDKATEQPEAERTKEVSGEDENERVVPNEATNGIIGPNWSSVSPEIAANYMASKTGVSASKWLDVIYKESSGNPYALNSLSCYGLLQIMQSVHGQVSNLSPQEYLDKAVSIYQGSGGTAWETW